MSVNTLPGFANLRAVPGSAGVRHLQPAPQCADLHERGSVRLQQPLGDVLELARLGDDDTLLVLRGRQMHVHLTDRLDTLPATASTVKL